MKDNLRDEERQTNLKNVESATHVSLRHFENRIHAVRGNIGPVGFGREMRNWSGAPVRQNTHCSFSKINSNRGLICSILSGANRNRVQRDCSAGMIFEA